MMVPRILNQQLTGSQSGVPRPAASAWPGNRLEVQMFVSQTQECLINWRVLHTPQVILIRITVQDPLQYLEGKAVDIS